MTAATLISLLLSLLLPHKFPFAFAFAPRHANGATGSTSGRAVYLRSVPSLIVFDLDNTLWTPELYQLRSIARDNRHPVAHRDVKLFPGAHKIIQQIKEDPEKRFVNTKFAVASRTKSVDWAHSLLDQFKLRDVFNFVEIFPGDKKRHFRNLRRASGIDFSEMLFFDDARCASPLVSLFDILSTI